MAGRLRSREPSDKQCLRSRSHPPLMAAAGLPVVASRLDGLPEAVLHNTTGLLFEPGNVDALADSLALLLDRPDVAEQLGQRGRARCEQELNLRVQRERFCEVLRRYVAP